MKSLDWRQQEERQKSILYGDGGASLQYQIDLKMVILNLVIKNVTKDESNLVKIFADKDYLCRSIWLSWLHEPIMSWDVN